DRDVEVIDQIERLNGQADGPRDLLGGGRGGDADEIEVARAQRGEEVGDRGTRAQPDAGPVPDLHGGGLGGGSLLVFGGVHAGADSTGRTRGPARPSSPSYGANRSG